MERVIQGTGKSILKRYMVTALLLALAVTGGTFAYAYTSTTTALTVTDATEDFAQVTANMTVPSYTVFGSYRGAIQAGNLFNVIPRTGYPGDVEVSVYLSNIDQLGTTYGLFLLRVELRNAAGSKMDVEGITKCLSLSNGVVSFTADNLTAGTEYFIYTTGGIYRTFPWAYLTSQTQYAPSLYAEVIQVGI
ncbi:hypothetical protein ACFLW4_04500 [Chloroflexota bacterium]